MKIIMLLIGVNIFWEYPEETRINICDQIKVEYFEKKITKEEYKKLLKIHGCKEGEK